MTDKLSNNPLSLLFLRAVVQTLESYWRFTPLCAYTPVRVNRTFCHFPYTTEHCELLLAKYESEEKSEGAKLIGMSIGTRLEDDNRVAKPIALLSIVETELRSKDWPYRRTKTNETAIDHLIHLLLSGGRGEWKSDIILEAFRSGQVRKVDSEDRLHLVPNCFRGRDLVDPKDDSDLAVSLVDDMAHALAMNMFRSLRLQEEALTYRSGSPTS